MCVLYYFFAWNGIHDSLRVFSFGSEFYATESLCRFMTRTQLGNSKLNIKAEIPMEFQTGNMCNNYTVN